MKYTPIIPPEELSRIRNYLSPYPRTVSTETPETVPLAKQLLDYVDYLLVKIESLEKMRDKLLERLQADPERSSVAAIEGLTKIMSEDVVSESIKAEYILDWIGVAGDLPLDERVKILAITLAMKQGLSLEEAEHLAETARLKEPESPFTTPEIEPVGPSLREKEG